MHLGATDTSLNVQIWAFRYLKNYAFRSFPEDYEDYLVWYAEWGDRPLNEVLIGNARAFVQELFRLFPEEQAARLRDFDDLDLRVAIAGSEERTGLYMRSGFHF